MNTAIRTAETDSVDTEQRSAEEGVELSVLVTVHDLDLATTVRELHAECTDELGEMGLQYEFIIVLEKKESGAIDELLRLKEESEASVTIVALGGQYGSATALSVGVDHAAGETILSVPAFLRMEPGAIKSLVSEIKDRDLVLLRRSEERRGTMVRSLDKLLRFPLRLVVGGEPFDLRRSVLIFRKEVVQAIDIFGDKDRYLPILARRFGFEVEVVGREKAERRDGGAASPTIRGGVSRLLDLLSIFFLTEFTQKPLRFFGFFGLTSLSGGLLICLYLTVERLFMGIPLADKPMLLLGVLLIVLGVILLSIGLIGEMVIFTNGKSGSANSIEEIIN